MSFLSETTKKERRSLLAASLAGLVIAWLQAFPTHIDVLGMRFSGHELPFVALGALNLVIGYFWAKFIFSYVYEWAQSENERLAAQIREGKTALDIAHAETLLKEQIAEFQEKQRVAQGQQTNEKNRIEAMEKNVEKNVVSKYDDRLEALKKQLSALNENLDSLGPQLDNEPLGTAHNRRRLGERMLALKTELETVEKDREAAREKGLADVNNERRRASEFEQASLKELSQLEKDILSRTQSIAEWKRTHKTSKIFRPLYNSFELILPVLLGIAALIALTHLMLHPPPSKDIVLPPM